MSTSTRTAKAEMMIRKPISEVFEAFTNPEVTTKYWFTDSTGKLVSAAKVNWIWKMYDLTVPVEVVLVDPNKKIQIKWGADEHQSTVVWEFTSLTDSKTFVQIINSDFKGTEEEVINKVIDSTGGFTMVLAGAKAWLEHGVELGLIGDKFPKEMW